MRWTELFKLALWESRHHRSRLIFCGLTVVFGVAALTAISSFKANLEHAVEEQALTLIGADLQITARIPFSPEAEAFFEKLGGTQSREIRFSSMAYFPKGDGSRLVQVRALEGAFPYYGEFETEPAGAWERDASTPIAVLEDTLMDQYGLEPGDVVRLGSMDFTVRGQILRVPGEAAFAGLFAPRIYIPMAFLEKTGLIGQGTIAFYRQYFDFGGREDYLPILENAGDLLAEERLQWENVASKKKEIGASLDNLNRFLSLTGFVALLLGGIGIAGGVHLYLQDKIGIVALLRCLGAGSRTASSIFWIQVLLAATVGATAGLLCGLAIQQVLPELIQPFLPFTINHFIHPPSLLEAWSFGLLLALLFSLLPLLPLRKVPPMRVLRSVEHASSRDPLQYVLITIIGAVLLLYCLRQVAVWWHALVFAGGLLFAMLIISGIGWSLREILRRFTILGAAFPVRQALSNLYRPQNRTIFLIVCLGTGVFLIFSLYLVQNALLQQSDFRDRDGEPNLLFYDIQEDQQEGMRRVLQEAGMEVIEDAPIVTMRLHSVNGRSLRELREDPENPVDEWILNREWRSTYRSQPSSTETVVAGEFIGEWTAWREPVPLSLEEGIAKDLHVGLGDRLVFDVQGVLIECEVASLRSVEWTRMRPNFFAAFPTGVLESAPTWYMAVTYSPSPAVTANLQKEMVRLYPNIAAVDLRIILDTLNDILGRISFVIRFLSAFTILTGLIVLVGTIVSSRYQRIRESAILRTLGAARRQIQWILIVEYLILGTLAGTAGVLLATIAAWALGVHFYGMKFSIPWVSCLIAIFLTTAITLAAGLFTSRGIASQSPLQLIREED